MKQTAIKNRLHKPFRKYIIYFLSLLITIAVSHKKAFGANLIKNKNVRVNRGVVDITNWDFNSEPSLFLNGEWKFFWESFIFENGKKDSINNRPVFVKVPEVWNNYKKNYSNSSGNGYGSFRIKIIKDTNTPPLSLKIIDIGTSFSIFENGEKIASSGNPGVDKKRSNPKLSPMVVDLKGNNSSIDIVFHVSNFHYCKGGIWKPIELGTKSYLNKKLISDVLLDYFFLGCLLLISLYHLVIFFFKRNDYSHLYLGILCLVICLRVLTAAGRGIYYMYPETSHSLLISIEYLTFYLSIPIAALLYNSLFPDEFRKMFLYIIIPAGVIFSIIVLSLPVSYFTKTVKSYQLITIAVLIYLFIVTVKAVIRKREGAVIILSGGIVCFFAVLNDILLANNLIASIYLVPFGLLTYTFLHAIVLSKRFSISYDAVEKLKIKLESNNLELEKRVERKTKELTQSEFKYQSLIDSLTDNVWIMELKDLSFSYISSTCYNLIGYTPEEIYSMKLKDVITKDSFNHAVSRMGESLKEANPKPGTIGLEHIHKDGHIIHTEISATPIMDDNGNVRAVLGVTRDISDRKIAEENLKNSEEKYRTIIQNISEGYFEVDLEGTLLFCNNSFLNITGYSKEELIGKKYSHVMLPEDVSQIYNIFHEVFATEKPSNIFDWKFKRSDNSIRIAEGSSTVIKNSRKEKIGFRGVLRDNTEKKLAEDELKRMKTQLSEAQRIAHTGSLEYHINSNSVIWSDYFYEILGYAPGEIEPSISNFQKHIIANDVERINLIKEMALEQNKNSSFVEFTFKTKDGQERVGNVISNITRDKSGNAVKIYETFQDVTDIKSNQMKLNIILDALGQGPICILITDSEGNIEYVNTQFTNYTGYEPEDALGKNPRILNSGKHPESFYKDLWDTILKGNTWRGELINKKADGSLYYEDTVISPVFNDENEITHFVALKEDVTRKKELVKLRQDVDRMMKHDLKGPLAAIMGYPEILSRKNKFDSESLGYLKNIETAAHKMLMMINNSLDIFKMETGKYNLKPELVDVLQLLHLITGDLKSKCSAKDISINVYKNSKLFKKDDSVIVLGEELMFYSIFSNLLNNAIEASQKNATIQIHFDTADGILIKIHNKGVVDKSIRGNFFDKYITFGKDSGTGLGTYSAKLMAETMGGKISMESTEESGTTITIKFES